MKSKRQITFHIAEIIFSLFSEHFPHDSEIKETYRNFLCTKKPDISIHAYYDNLIDIPLHDKDKIFDSGTLWSLYRMKEKYIFVLKTLTSGKQPYRIAVFDNNFKRGEVYSAIHHLDSHSNNFLPNPLEFPLSEVLMVCILAQKSGLMVHACGIEDEGKGYLFAGNSTHGKTTVAQLWKDHATILNDDRIIIRYKNGHFWMYGTPWHGDYDKVSPDGVPLKRIFFLHHNKVNTVNQKTGAIAASKILSRCFPPLWDAEGMQFTLDFCAGLVETVPCYELGFVPDKKIIDFVRCVK